MLIKNFPNWNPIEESKDSTTFEGSLQSKMSTIKLDKDIMDLLRAKRDRDHINMTRWASAILRKELTEDANKGIGEELK